VNQAGFLVSVWFPVVMLGATGSGAFCGSFWRFIPVIALQAWVREGESGKSCWTTHFEMADDAHSSSVHYTSCFLNMQSLLRLLAVLFL
jgi:hypothetical protein